MSQQAMSQQAMSQHALSQPGHVVLLGDSVFDNAAYVAGGPDLVRQLRARLPGDWRATLLAVDGAVTRGVAAQLARMPPDASHLVVSVGGNDALRDEATLAQPARNLAAALLALGALRERFAAEYRAMLEGVLRRGLPTAVCTVYDPRFADPQRQRVAVTGLALFNDVIGRLAFAQGIPLLDLRLICSEDADYANPIEPSAQGGAKIAGAIARLVAAHDFSARRSAVFTG
jgi:lysophospholipase L1-like esterase